MSVVNQMLRDLDARGRGPTGDAALAAGVTSVAAPRRAPPWLRRTALALAATTTLAGGVLATGGWALAEAPAAPPRVAAVARPSVTAVVEPTPAPLPSPPAAPAATPTPPAAPARPQRVAIAAPVARSVSPRPAAAASTPPAPIAAAAAAPTKHFAFVDRVQSARELWQSGQGDAAIALLREALGAPSGDPAARSAAARELARLELMSRDPAAALATLDRHAAELRGDAQAWALRGNAAQRLGRHDDAVLAFESAVRLQGDDSRSMLGAAVSLAASGDLAQSRTWAERARGTGAVPADVLAYLSRAGVTLDR